MGEFPAESASPAPAIDVDLQPSQKAADQNVDWAVNICLAFAAQPIQAPNAYAEAGLALVMCAFASLFLSKCRCFGFKTSGVMQRVGVFFGVTAFFVRVTTDSSLWLKCAGGIVYSLIWLAIIVITVFNKRAKISFVKEWMSKMCAQV